MNSLMITVNESSGRRTKANDQMGDLRATLESAIRIGREVDKPRTLPHNFHRFWPLKTFI